MKPDKVIVMGKVYSIEYVEKPSDVDIFKRDSLWGQIDYWTRSIRIFDDGSRSIEDVWHTIFHELLHAIAGDLKLSALDDEKNHDELDLLALALIDVLFRNDWIKNE